MKSRIEIKVFCPYCNSELKDTKLIINLKDRILGIKGTCLKCKPGTSIGIAEIFKL